MLKITPNPTFVTTVFLHVAGEAEPAEIKVTFKYLDREQLKEWQKKHGGRPVNEALEEIIQGWDGVAFDDGNAALYSAENLKKVLVAYHTAGDDITQAYFREVLGARRKN